MTETVREAGYSTGADVLTFLIADVRGYTQFTVEHGDEAAARLATRFAELTEEVVAAHQGQVIELRGDEALAVFSSARQALRAAVDLQGRVAAEADDSLPIKVGIGMDAGEAIPVKGGYRGAALNLAARLCSLAGAGEVLASETVIGIARKLEGVVYAERGMAQLKGFADPVKVIQVKAEELDGWDAAKPDADEGASHAMLDQHLPIGGFLGSLPSGILVGRNDEMEQILTAVVEAAEGNGRLVLLAGEPGAGKTRLAQEVTLHARNRGFLIAAGSCFEPQEALPYYPFLDVLAALYGGTSPGLRSQAANRWPYLGRLLPEAGIPVPVSAEGSEEQQRLFRSITGFVQTITEATPVAILLDDLHWADAASLDLLQHLARHTRVNRLLMVATYRDVEVNKQHPLERALRDLHRAGLVKRVLTRRLDQEGTAALVAATMGEEQVSEEFTRLVYQQTEGNPFFTQEVLRALVERGDVYRENGHWERREIEEIEVPESIRSVIGERLARLSDENQDVLRAAGVLGQTFTFDDLQAVVGQSEDEVEEALEHATAAGLVRVDANDVYAFNHALTQQTLYGELNPRRKRRLHLAAGEAVERLPERKREGRVAELAWHFLHGDDPERALQYSLLAGNEAASLFAQSEAEGHYETAVELARELGDRDKEAEALEKLAAVLVTTGRYAQAIGALSDAERRHGETGDLDGVARVAASAGFAHRGLGTADEGIAHVRRVLDSIDQQATPRGAALLLAVLGHLYFVKGSHREALDAAERAAQLAQSLGDTRLLADAQARRGTALAQLGRPQEGIPILEEAARLAETVGDLYTAASASANAASEILQGGDLLRAAALDRRALEFARRAGNAMQAAYLMAELGEIETLRGDWTAAQELVDVAVEIVRSLEVSWPTSYPLIAAGRLRVHTGDWKGASALLEEATKISEKLEDWQGIGAAEQVAAQRDLLYGYPGEARERLERVLGLEGIGASWTQWLVPILVEARLELGEVSEVAEALTEPVKIMRANGQLLPLAAALRVQVILLIRLGQWEEAARSLEEALQLARSMPWGYLEGRLLYERGRMLMQQREKARAREELQSALAIFQRLGARRDIERTEQELAALERSADLAR